MTTQLSLFGDCDQSIQDKKPVKPQDAQLSMFAGSELAQFGIKANPIMPIPQDCTARLALEIQDIRTPEQKESDLRHDAESLTVPLPESAPAPEPQIPDYDNPAEAWQPALLVHTFNQYDRFGELIGVLSSDPQRYQSDTEEWCADSSARQFWPKTCPVCQQAITEFATTYDGVWYHQPCHTRLTDYQNRVEARLARLQRSAQRAQNDFEQTSARAHQMADAIPFGQPVMGVRDRNYRDKLWKTQERAYEHYRRAERLQRKAQAAQHNRAISSDDPEAIVKLEEKLAQTKALHAEMLRVNKTIRQIVKSRPSQAERDAFAAQKRGMMGERNEAFHQWMTLRNERINSLIKYAPELAKALGCTEERARQYLTPDMLGRIGFPDYSVTLNNAEVRRIEDRIESLKRQRAQAAQHGNSETQFGSILVIRNLEMNRVQIEFPGKPAPAIIAELKQHAFKWSPTQGRWQRFLSDWAVEVAENIARKANQK